MHTAAPTIDLGVMGIHPYTVHTMQDFAVLPSGGVITLGGLIMDDVEGRSIEHYGPQGELVNAWGLEGYPAANGVLTTMIQEGFSYGNTRKWMVLH